jgi:pyruvate/2-oxoglutarate dehydrogenase complex dihydrolipoamide dehydrogenase (E3) component
VIPDKGSGTYNVVVIGAGTAGLVTAAGTAGLGGRVALIERSRMGGDCLNTGCVPSKALLASARLIARIRRAPEWGLEALEPKFEFGSVLARVRQRRARIAPNDSQERFEGLGVDVFRGEARFLSPREIEVGSMRLRGRNFVIAAGSRAGIPPVEGLAETPHYTNETIFDRLDTKPERMIVIGGGPIGCELGQAFGRLGVRVTILQRPTQILPREDPDAAEVLRRRLEAEGVRILERAEPVRVRDAGRARRVDVRRGDATIETIEADAILVAAGRVPNVEGLGLEAAGVRYGRRGIEVDGRLRTSQSHIYACGDIAGPYQFTHMADYQARVVVRNILIPWLPQKADYSVVPWCTYTSPEVARVGLNESQARERGLACDVWQEPFSELDRAVVEGEEEGFAKILTAKGSDRILGVSLVAEHAGDLLHEFVLAMKTGAGLSAIGSAIHAYPTFAEVARKLADRRRRTQLTPLARALFSWIYRRQRGGRR